MKTTPEKSVEEIENELEARLQMIPHHLDRRKFRGMIQRIRRIDKTQTLQAERQKREEMVEAERERIMAIPTIKGHSRNGGGGDTGLIRKLDIYGDTK